MNRIVQVVSYYNPPHVGGMEIRARERAERLAAAGWLVETLTSSEETYPHSVTSPGLVVRYLRSLEVARTPIIFGLPLALLRMPGDSAVQVETAIAYVPEVTALICKLRRIPYIARVPLDVAGHSKLRDRLLSLYKRSILRWVYRTAQLVIVLTRDDVDLMAAKYAVDPERIRVIPNATSFSVLSSPRRSPGQPLRLLFAGRVAIQKNLPLLLETVRFFGDTYAQAVHLDLIGDGELMPVVRRTITDLSLQEHVTLHGYVTGSDLERLYEQADVFVMTSTNESFPQVLLEAMAKGLPVVAGDIHGVRTVVEDHVTGLLVDLRKEKFAEAFHRLLTEDGLYQRLSAGSLERVKAYSWSSTIQAYISVYEELAATRRGRHVKPPSDYS